MKEKMLLQTAEQLNRGAILSGVGFLLYLGALALGWEAAADILTMAFALVAVYVFASACSLREREKEQVSYSLLWGTGSLALLLGGCAVLTVKARLGL